ncbi:lytic transglycosylase domain-containing protein [Nocardioides sp. CER19]|uniref:lytic transglycosylase domain-containing protein n=1 Tax=Nocardioides sp. CER19 TaxID=3038538 RepID=UPI00244A66D0|nr:lytic transglycosylase domain-containing protein [Nocardioides sp. CER19]MDH2414260.1 lytic transglycosylase domain-containing protein [Nocardioides sp. CER19]
MSVTRQSRWKKAAALVPLALLSAAWTVSISTTGAPEASAGDKHPTLPDGSTVPGGALQVPASVSAPGTGALGATGESAAQIVSGSSASSIPSAALAAYQRAETVINKADKTCSLPWQLLAAIGRVESNHGRANGNRLSPTGIAQPGIFGKPLNGRASTSQIVDTDAGQYDGDTKYDRAVGPMQFIPSTWSTVGVDADGDGRRNPQDINDAALAAAVYLCSGTDDLSSSAGRSHAVYRYNHSSSYVATVLRVMQAYLAGDYTAAPDDTIPATYFEPDPAPVEHRAKPQRRQTSSPSGAHTSSAAPSAASAPSGGGPTSAPAPTAPKPSASAVPHASLPTAATQPVVAVLDAAEALTLCNQQIGALPDPLGLLAPVKNAAVQSCAQKVKGQTRSAALAMIPNTVSGLLHWLGLG